MFACAAACAKSPTAPAPEPPPVEPAPLRCREQVEGTVLARVETRGCPVLLVAGENDTLTLVSLDLEGRGPAVGTMPEVCRGERCMFWGVDTKLGPVVVAVLQTAASEMAGGAQLGAARDDALRFVDLWAGAGEPVSGDGTDLGPAFSLEPWVCDDGLGLFVGPRLPAARGTDPPAELVARQGIYALSGEWEKTDSSSREGCEKIAIELP